MIDSLILNQKEFYILFFILLFSIYIKNKYLIFSIIIIISFLVYFYRIPEYKFSSDYNNLISPCKGRIIKIKKTLTHYKLYIFLNALDPHIQIIPYSGKIIKYNFIEGEYQFAYKLEKDNYRSRFITQIQTDHGIIELIQNTGIFTRRIKNNFKLKDIVNKGNILGIIKFGSRVDISIPIKFRLKYKLYDDINLGDTLATLKY